MPATTDHLLLTNRNVCPKCHRKGVFMAGRRCLNCDARLLLPDDSFNRVEEDGLLSYWVFFKDTGWRHSDHLRSERQLPNERFPKLTPPPKGYGTRPLPKGCSDKI